MPPSSYYKVRPAVTSTATASTIAQFDAALSAATSSQGTEIKLAAGTYGSVGARFDRSIGKTVQIRPVNKGDRVKIHGSWILSASNIWLEDLEFTEDQLTPTGTEVGGTGISIQGFNCAVINCYIHDYGSTDTLPGFGHNCILDVAGVSGSLVYGSILTNSRHVLYCQNDGTLGVKHYVRNYIGDVKIPTSSNAFVIHGYSSSPLNVQRLEFQHNLVANGRCTTGSDGTGSPSSEICHSMIWDSNIFLRVGYQEYARINEVQFTNNRMYETTKEMAGGSAVPMLSWGLHHGAGEARFGYTIPSMFKNNLIYKPEDTTETNMLLTACHHDAITGARQVGTAGTALRPAADEPDVTPNTYYGFFRATVTANASSLNATDLATWRTNTQTKGNRWDDTSTLTAGSPPDYFEVKDNEYDSNRAMLFVWNSDGAGTVAVTLTRVADVYNITDPWGTPVHTGVTNFNAAVQAGNGNAGFYLVKYTGGTPVQIVRPTADTNNPDGYTDLGGGTSNLFGNLDETVVSTADGIRSVLAPTNDIIVFKLGNGTDPAVSNNHFFRISYGKDAAGGAQIDLTFQLRQSYVNEGSPGTQIFTQSRTNISDVAITDSYTMTQPEIDTITDYTALYTRIVFNQV